MPTDQGGKYRMNPQIARARAADVPPVEQPDLSMGEMHEVTCPECGAQFDASEQMTDMENAEEQILPGIHDKAAQKIGK